MKNKSNTVFKISFKDCNGFSMKNTAYKDGVTVLNGSENLNMRQLLKKYLPCKNLSEFLFIKENSVFLKYGETELLLFQSEREYDVNIEFKKLNEFFNELSSRENARLKNYVDDYVSTIKDKRDNYVSGGQFNADLKIVENYLKENDFLILKQKKYNNLDLSENDSLYSEIVQRLYDQKKNDQEEMRMIIGEIEFFYANDADSIFVTQSERFKK